MSEILTIYRRIVELRQLPTDEQQRKLAEYITGLPGRLNRLPRVEALPKPGATDEVDTIKIISGTTSSAPIRIETQFLLHDMDKYTRLNKQVSELLKQPTSTYTEQDTFCICEWLLYELRYVSGCSMRWKSPLKMASAPNSGRQPAQLTVAVRLRVKFMTPPPFADVPAGESASTGIVDISGDSDHGVETYAAIFLGDPRDAKGAAADDADCIVVDRDDANSTLASRPQRRRIPTEKAIKARARGAAKRP